jgi:hypothetical protein
MFLCYILSYIKRNRKRKIAQKICKRFNLCFFPGRTSKLLSFYQKIDLKLIAFKHSTYQTNLFSIWAKKLLYICFLFLKWLISNWIHYLIFNENPYSAISWTKEVKKLAIVSAKKKIIFVGHQYFYWPLFLLYSFIFY